VGGTMGLFIGASFFTLVEMIKIVLEMMGSFLVKKKEEYQTKFRQN